MSEINFKTCNQCGNNFDTAGLICLDCIEVNFKAGDIDKEVLDANVRIHREENVFLNSIDNSILSAQEAAGIDLEHESFCITSIIFDTQGIEKPDWNDLMVDHIKDLKKKMMKFKVQEGAARRVLNKRRIKETEKLSPDERDAYIRDIERGSKLSGDKKIEKRQKEKQTLIDKQIESLLKLGMKEDSEAIMKLRSLQK